ncbi:hypothetical protein CC85DRAFT_282529 [Cutaneotrichosporon oleaginosum]|uniref:tRNA isopentenyltransferase n=1 Tax=Cutaneotrichosporon oleaginosum TaxID=879819 RepID=A0A0J1BBS8_9TREE|nr:uncharacterized protein CC85DRAFT_282529 [Cutaneotrichosporon oleaginosum]KLT45449.1 hypothetical protein CC85DRAFT_282529 [Cutaneotrichosporon oleaginosum]TXT14592.1 hypothetical protein COLE_00785 [Cutaneotrichosporon oleaginosum]
MTTAVPQRPVIAVVGTTGVGKSNLAVSLCNALPSLSASSTRPLPSKGKVLSADSMQLYKGMDVITNKVTVEEQGGVEHWGLDVVQPGEDGSWEVGKWCNAADRELEHTPESTLPVICGGTHYFIQHFLFPPDELVLDRQREEERKNDALAIRWTPPRAMPPVPEDMDPDLLRLLETFWRNDAVYPPEGEAEASGSQRLTSRPVAETDHQLLSLWRVLEAVDPNDSVRWHWRDGRKVRRSIERWWERGGGEVEAAESGSGRSARFRTLIFWVYEPLANLKDRLDARVDKMVESGLLDEIAELRQIARRVYGSEEATDMFEGIFQAIGYKEFAGLPLPQERPFENPEFRRMLDLMKISTHRYAKSQIKWIKKQLLPAVHEARSRGGDVHIYVVPGGAQGEPLAQDIMARFLRGEALPDPATVGHPEAAELLKILAAEPARVADTADRQVLNARRICEDCSAPGKPFSVREVDWSMHLKSKVHRLNTKYGGMSREEFTAMQKAQGLARKAALDAERAKAKLASEATESLASETKESIACEAKESAFEGA